MRKDKKGVRERAQEKGEVGQGSTRSQVVLIELKSPFYV